MAKDLSTPPWGDIDLWMTFFSLEANCLLVNDGTGYFGDLSFDLGLAKPSFHLLGFGTLFMDYDHNGWSDLIDATMTYAQSLQIFANCEGEFEGEICGTGLDQSLYWFVD